MLYNMYGDNTAGDVTSSQLDSHVFFNKMTIKYHGLRYTLNRD